MSKMKMIRDSVSEEELLELAKQINFEVKDDQDLLRLFRASADLGFWPGLDVPKPDPDGRKPSIGVTAEPKMAHQKLNNWGCLGGLPDEVNVSMTKTGLKITYPNSKQFHKKSTTQIKNKMLQDLIKLTSEADAIDPNIDTKDIDDFLDSIK